MQVDDHRAPAHAQPVVHDGGDGVGVGTEIRVEQLGGAGVRLKAQRRTGAGAGVDRTAPVGGGRFLLVGQPFGVDHQPREPVDRHRRPPPCALGGGRVDVRGAGVGGFVQLGRQLRVVEQQLRADRWGMVREECGTCTSTGEAPAAGRTWTVSSTECPFVGG